jgi:hypothetical protein
LDSRTCHHHDLHHQEEEEASSSWGQLHWHSTREYSLQNYVEVMMMELVLQVQVHPGDVAALVVVEVIYLILYYLQVHVSLSIVEYASSTQEIIAPLVVV